MGVAGEAAERGDAARPLTVWRISDGKPGHDNQSLGLAEAIAGLIRTEVISLPAGSVSAAIRALVTRDRRRFGGHPAPDLILGAGHGTHLDLLAARRAHGGRTVVLMTPSLPSRLFDLCLIPEHDRPLPGPRVIVTRGALNRVRPSADRDPRSGLILLGGPSRHVLWSDAAIMAQVAEIIGRTTGVDWTLAPSRRTPPALTDRLAARHAARIRVRRPEETPPGWLAAELGRAAIVWVSEDSASMVYEALSGGAAVGLVTVAHKTRGRIARGMARLAREGLLIRYDDWLGGARLEPPAKPLDEAGRCAGLILERWPGLARG